MDDDKLLILADNVGKLKKQVRELSDRAETIKKLEGPQGPEGRPGKDGTQGLQGPQGPQGVPGRDGKDGKDGKDGQDGISVVDAEVAADGSLVFKLSDGNEIDAGPLLTEKSQGVSTAVIQQYAGPRIFVQATAPVGASVGDIWFDIS